MGRKDASAHNVNNYEPCNHPGEACTPTRNIITNGINGTGVIKRTYDFIGCCHRMPVKCVVFNFQS